MSLLRASVLMLAVSVSTGCDKPPPTLATMVEPVVTAQRIKGGALQAILTWDTAKTSCGTLSGFSVTIDDQPINASAGVYNPDAREENLKCQFPGFLTSIDDKNTPRTLVFTDDSSTFTVTVDTLNVGTATPFTKPTVNRAGDTIRWDSVLPSQNTSSWKAGFTSDDGSVVQTWDAGSTLPSTIVVTVPQVVDPASGNAELSWTINSTVSRCEGPTTCDVTLEGYASFGTIINP